MRLCDKKSIRSHWLLGSRVDFQADVVENINLSTFVRFVQTK